MYFFHSLNFSLFLDDNNINFNIALIGSVSPKHKILIAGPKLFSYHETPQMISSRNQNSFSNQNKTSPDLVPLEPGFIMV